MNLTDKQKKGAAYAVVGLLGWFSGTFLPPEVVAQIIGAF